MKLVYALDKTQPERYCNELWDNENPNPHILTFNINHPNIEKIAPVIAAAPDLLNALLIIRDLKEMDLIRFESDDDYQTVLAAINKATGGTL